MEYSQILVHIVFWKAIVVAALLFGLDTCRYHQNNWAQGVGGDGIWFHLLTLGIGICHVIPFPCGNRDPELRPCLKEFPVPINKFFAILVSCATVTS